MKLLLFGLVKSSHKEAVMKPLLFEDQSDLTSPACKHSPAIDIAVSVVFIN